MTTGSIKVGELLCEVVVNFTKITDYGVSLPEFMSGSVAIPPEGARFDAAYQGTFLGPRISGTVEGVDYLHIRADGRFDLHIHRGTRPPTDRTFPNLRMGWAPGKTARTVSACARTLRM
jgi:hypothetical protein